MLLSFNNHCPECSSLTVVVCGRHFHREGTRKGSWLESQKSCLGFNWGTQESSLFGPGRSGKGNCSRKKIITHRKRLCSVFPNNLLLVYIKFTYCTCFHPENTQELFSRYITGNAAGSFLKYYLTTITFTPWIQQGTQTRKWSLNCLMDYHMHILKRSDAFANLSKWALS